MKLFVVLVIFGMSATAERSIQQIPACQRAAAKVPSGWQVFENEASHLRLSIPTGMHEVEKPQIWCIHGCRQWVRGSFSISVSFGMWGADSFEEDEWKSACVDHRKKLDVVEMRSSKTSTLLWPVDESFVVNVAAPDKADQGDARAVIDSLRKY